jgi:hypothetical protein
MLSSLLSFSLLSLVAFSSASPLAVPRDVPTSVCNTIVSGYLKTSEHTMTTPQNVGLMDFYPQQNLAQVFRSTLMAISSMVAPACLLSSNHANPTSEDTTGKMADHTEVRFPELISNRVPYTPTPRPHPRTFNKQMRSCSQLCGESRRNVPRFCPRV